jgi:hypothetical protein
VAAKARPRAGAGLPGGIAGARGDGVSTRRGALPIAAGGDSVPRQSTGGGRVLERQTHGHPGCWSGRPTSRGTIPTRRFPWPPAAWRTGPAGWPSPP